MSSSILFYRRIHRLHLFAQAVLQQVQKEEEGEQRQGRECGAIRLVLLVMVVLAANPTVRVSMGCRVEVIKASYSCCSSAQAAVLSVQRPAE